MITVPAIRIKIFPELSEIGAGKILSLRWFFSFIFLIAFSGLLAQNTGDYRSAGNVNFEDATNWEVFNGTSWVAASSAPTDADGTVTIQTGHTATVSNTTPSYSINDLDVYGTIDFDNDLTFTVYGNVHVYSSGVFQMDQAQSNVATLVVYGNFINEGTTDFTKSNVIIAGNVESTETSSIDNNGYLVVGGDVTGNVDLGGSGDNQLYALNPNATIDITDTRYTNNTDTTALPDAIMDIVNETLYGSSPPCDFEIYGPVNTTSCSGSTVYLIIDSTTASSPTYQWEVNDGVDGWQDITNGGVYSGATSATLSISSADASIDGYIFRCNVTVGTPCTKKSFSATLTVLSATPPTAPTTTGATGCSGSALTLSAGGAGIGEDYKWYDASAGGATLQTTGASYTTPTLTTTTTYYASVYNTTSGCESGRTAATATINTTPSTSLAVSDASICNPAAGDVTITITGAENGVSYELTDGGTSLSPAVTGTGTGADLNLTILQANAPTTTTTYTIEATIAGCAMVSLTDQPAVTVNPLPTPSAGSYGPLCIDAAAITVTGTPTDAGGTWSGTGITDNGD
ncbi:MAG: hypothetical protein K9J30_15145, partial [Bacteroidales bacterium]|nr:hypothetical protein [Bacteroidales bacterium]